MRIALFFDGKNYYSGWKDVASHFEVNYERLSGWLKSQVGGGDLWGAYYYTGVESEPTEKSVQLEAFLVMLELLPGYFVKRFPRKKKSWKCSQCRTRNDFTMEKEVDTTMVADMLRLAAVDAFDIMILLSGDADHCPAVEGVRALGKQAYVASWAKLGLSPRLRKAAFDHIDLAKGLHEFAVEKRPKMEKEKNEIRSTSPLLEEIKSALAPANSESAFLSELAAAEQKLANGYVGVSYFVSGWRSDVLDASPIVRRRILNKLIDAGSVEIYSSPDGKKAMRIKVSPLQGSKK